MNTSFSNLKGRISYLLANIGHEVSEKFRNINGKTAQGNVPIELFQRRTSRRNRVLIPYKTVYKNNLTIEQLETFEGGVCVDSMSTGTP